MNRPTRLPGTLTFYVIQTITVSRVPLAVAFAAVLASAQPPQAQSFPALTTCLILVALIECTDFVDGLLARRTKVVTELGALLDPYADSVSRIIVYWGLASAGLVAAFVPLVMAVRDVTVAYSRILLIRYGRPGSARLSGKVKAVFQAVGAVLALTGPLYWSTRGTWTVAAISWTVAVVTLASSVEYVLDAALAVRRAKHTADVLTEEIDHPHKSVG